jgi:sterol desaturase/sphingolipid hydroxylase (fatty acid hydroxylase superfamily)
MSAHTTVFTDPSTHLMVLGIAAAFIGLELLMSRLADRDRDTHDFGESAATLGVAIGHSLLRAAGAGLLAIPFAFAYHYRLFDFSATTPLALGALFLATEFVYYWHHRAAHRVRWMWATHSVHHSPTKFNLTAALRLGWTAGLSGDFLFFLPLALLGFHPVAIIGMLSANLLYQFFIHTQIAPKLGPLEWILNTPAHHSVHHASNAACLDKNYGGVLILFDRLFGTFAEAPKDEPLRFGLVGGARTLNPFRIAFGEWIALVRDFRRVDTLEMKWLALFGPPGTVKPAAETTTA